MKYKNKYRIPSTRLAGWDYRSNAPYYITICTAKRRHIFGHINEGKMHLNELGEYASSLMASITEYRENAEIINYVIMPDHVHVLLELSNNTGQWTPNRFGPLLKNSLSVIINQYKGRVTRYAKDNNLPYGWQARYHEWVIKDQKQYIRVFNYITNNPSNWSNPSSAAETRHVARLI